MQEGQPLLSSSEEEGDGDENACEELLEEVPGPSPKRRSARQADRQAGRALEAPAGTGHGQLQLQASGIGLGLPAREVVPETEGF